MTYETSLSSVSSLKVDKRLIPMMYWCYFDIVVKEWEQSLNKMRFPLFCEFLDPSKKKEILSKVSNISSSFINELLRILCSFSQHLNSKCEDFCSANENGNDQKNVFKTVKRGEPIHAIQITKARASFVDTLSKNSYWGTYSSLLGAESRAFLPISPQSIIGVLFSWFEYLRKGCNINDGKECLKTYLLSHARMGVEEKPFLPKSRWDRSYDEIEPQDPIFRNKHSRNMDGKVNYYEFGGAEHEWVVYQQIKMVNIHSITNTYPPKYVRSALQAALQVFPYNPYFLSSLIEIEGHFTAYMKRYFDELLNEVSKQPDPSPTLWCFALHPEITRSFTTQELSLKSKNGCIKAVQKSHRIIRLFERGFETSLKYSVALWRFYIRYHLAVCDIEGAKRVYYRAIHQCPWSKMLWMDGLRWLGLLNPSLSFGGMKGILREVERAKILNKSVALDKLAEMKIGKGLLQKMNEDVDAITLLSQSLLQDSEIVALVDLMGEKEVRIYTNTLISNDMDENLNEDEND